jgi:hypothetical protein
MLGKANCTGIKKMMDRSVNRGRGRGAWGVKSPLLPKINRKKRVHAPLLLKISFFWSLKQKN